jgi:hypothetical protein
MPQGLTDGLFGIGMLLLTGTDAFLNESTIFEILSKFGVIAVLWYWLKDLKEQLKEQLGEFRDETKEILIFSLLRSGAGETPAHF